jgi:pimeloyl-ACP methyl ester carboxylesterase
LAATMIVDRLMATAPTAIGRSMTIVRVHSRRPRARDPSKAARARRHGGLSSMAEHRIVAPKGPLITVPTITLEGDANGAPHPEAASYREKFTGPYAHHVLTGGVGHNPAQEAPRAFVDAVVEVDRF